MSENRLRESSEAPPIQTAAPPELPADRLEDLEHMFRVLEEYMMETKRVSEMNRVDVERMEDLNRKLRGATTATLVLLVASVGATTLTAMLALGIIRCRLPKQYISLL